MKEGEHTIVAQAVSVGKPFNRRLGGEVSGKPITLTKRTVVVVGWNLDTDEVAYVDFDDCPVPAGDLPHIAHSQASEIDNTFVDGLDFSTVMRRRSSRPYHDTDKAVVAKGGNPNYKIPKPANSFALGIKPSEAGRKNQPD